MGKVGTQWKQIAGYGGRYWISSDGQVSSDAYGKRKVLKPYYSKGYPAVTLSWRCIPESVRIHRLVAEYFLPNPENKKCINHKNFDRTDNRLENLEWCTQSENISHAYKHGRKVGWHGWKLAAAPLSQK